MRTTTARLEREDEEAAALGSAPPELTLLVTRRDEGERANGARDPERQPAARASSPEPGRRTVVITGQRPAPRRRPVTAERVGPRPDRIAMWAFFLGMFLVVVATATADAAPL